MKRFTIWRMGSLMGTYSGANEMAALNALAVDEGFADFEACNAAKGLVRDNYTVQEIKE